MSRPSQTIEQFWLRAALVCAGALLLLWTPLLNGFPLIYSDSGTYIFSGAFMYVPPDRSIGYGIFLYRINLLRSLWGVIILQALGTSYLTFRVADLLLKPMPGVLRAGLAFAIVALTALTTTVSTFVGFISPDVFTSWLFLGGVLFLVSPRRFDRVLASALLGISIWAHNSHLALAVGMLALPALGAIFLPRARTSWRRVLALGAVVAVTLVGIVAVNFYLRAGITLSRGGMTILLNRFVASGILARTLDTFCGETQWILCAHQERLREPHAQPDWFLWDADSPIAQVGWDKNEAEQRDLIAHALQCCAAYIVFESANESWKQFWLAQSATHIVALGDEWNVVQAIRRLYPNEARALDASVQQSRKRPMVTLLPIEEATSQLVFLALFLILFARVVYTQKNALALTMGAVLVLLVLNAVLVGTLNGAWGRYQARIIWLVPYCVYLASAALIFPRLTQRIQRRQD